MNIVDSMQTLWQSTGLTTITLGQFVMLLISMLLIYLGIAKQFEPLLLIPIGFGGILANIPVADIAAQASLILEDGVPHTSEVLGVVRWAASEPGFLGLIYSFGVSTGMFPLVIFIGVGAMTDFGPLIARPSSLLLGAAAQLGIYIAFTLAIALGFSPQAAASIGIIGGADGPTAIFLTTRLAPHLLPAVAVAAYSYMALIPVIQPPLMKLLTTKKEREVKMVQLRKVTKPEKIVFPIMVATLSILFLPDTAPLIGMLMLGNLFRESGCVDRLSDTAQNALCNIITILLGVSVGATAYGENFLRLQTLLIIGLGLLAFAFSTIGGLLFGKLMYWVTKGKVNPLIGSAGVSAVPMAARVSQIVGQKANPANFLLMHAMGPNVSGVIGSAIAAGFLLKIFG